jgi:tRNA threonylcarbamoyladenosine biosynthesis protein TsaB
MAGSPHPTPVNLLAFDTSTETMWIALGWRDGAGAQLLQVQEPGGARASAALIPSLQSLLSQAGLGLRDLDAIAFGRGPGSFTGLRTACAVAQGLAFGAARPVLPIDTLMAVAEEARLHTGAQRVVALLDARMDEVYSAAYAFDGQAWHRQGDFRLGAPEGVELAPGWALAGNAFAAYGTRLPPGEQVQALPTAAALLRLAPALLAAGHAVPAAAALPLYIRDKVAQTTEQRAATRAAAPAA